MVQLSIYCMYKLCRLYFFFQRFLVTISKSAQNFQLIFNYNEDISWFQQNLFLYLQTFGGAMNVL